MLKNLLISFLILNCVYCYASELKIAGASLKYNTLNDRIRTYKVKGKSYTTLNKEQSIHYEKIGIASYYAGQFNGRKTANGEIFSEYEYTAAHKTLALGTFALVTNLNNGRKIIVRINDRGPYHSSRIIDLSKSSARYLGMLKKGIAKVKVEAFIIDRDGYYQGKAVKSLEKIAKKQGVTLKTHPLDYKPPFPISGNFLKVEKLKTKTQASELARKIIARTNIVKNGNFYDLIVEIAHKNEINGIKKILQVFTHNKIISYNIDIKSAFKKSWHLKISNLNYQEAYKLSKVVKPLTKIVKNNYSYDLLILLNKKEDENKVKKQLLFFTRKNITLISPK